MLQKPEFTLTRRQELQGILGLPIFLPSSNTTIRRLRRPARVGNRVATSPSVHFAPQGEVLPFNTAPALPD